MNSINFSNFFNLDTIDFEGRSIPYFKRSNSIHLEQISDAVVDDEYVAFLLRLINKQKITGISLTLASCKSLDFLKLFSKIKYLKIDNFVSCDYSFLQFLPNLKCLKLNSFSPYIDLNDVKNLVELSINDYDPKKFKAFDCLSQLVLLNIWHLKKEKNLCKFANMSRLKHLDLRTASISSIEGIEKMHHLEYIYFANCTRISSIKPLKSLKKLRILRMSCCKKVQDFEEICTLKELEYLELEKCGELPFLDLVNKLPKLKGILIEETCLSNKDFVALEKRFNNKRATKDIFVANSDYDSLMPKISI